MSDRGANREGLAALLPLGEGHEEAMRETLRALPQGPKSPFARLPGTHFARLTLVAPPHGRTGTEARGIPFCLFFSAEFDSLPVGYLESLCRSAPRQAADMFGRCVGFPGTGAPGVFASWMLEHRVPAGFSAHGYPGVTAPAVGRALELRERIIAFAVETRHLEPAALKERWAQQEWGRRA